MHRKTAVLVSALAMILAASTVHAAKGEFLINLNGGVATPLSDYKDLAKLGFMGGVGFDYMATESFAVGADGSFISNSGSDLLETAATTAAGTATTAKWTLLQGGAHAKYMFPMAEGSSISPYVIGGVGVYNVKGKFDGSNTAFNDANEIKDTKFGLRGGLGLMYKTSEKVGIGVEGAFHWVNTKDDATGATATQFIGIQAGVTIGMGTPSAQ